MNQNIKTTEVLECICRVFNVSMEELMSKRKTWDIVKARHTSYRVLYMLVGSKLGAARLLGKDHTTVASGIKEFESLYKYDSKFRFKANQAMQEIIKIKYEETSDDQTKIR